MDVGRLKPVRNHLLASFTDDEFDLVRYSLTWVRLVSNQVLIEKGESIEHIYFIESGLVSVCDVLPNNLFVQVAIIGRECLVGGETILQGDPTSPVSYVVQQPSVALRMPMSEMRRLLPLCPKLEVTCTNSVKRLFRQIIETAGSNARNTVAERFIRLLLMMHDRIDGDDLFITHEALSAMLSVRRSGVTVVVSGLQDAGLVQVGRGRITILDRCRLEHQIAHVTCAAPTRLDCARSPGNTERQSARNYGAPVMNAVAVGR